MPSRAESSVSATSLSPCRHNEALSPLQCIFFLAASSFSSEEKSEAILTYLVADKAAESVRLEAASVAASHGVDIANVDL